MGPRIAELDSVGLVYSVAENQEPLGPTANDSKLHRVIDPTQSTPICEKKINFDPSGEISATNIAGPENSE